MGTFRRIIEEEREKVAMMQSSAQAQARRKGIGVKVWMVVSETGESHIEEVEKHSIMRRTGLPARDLRVLDPMLSYPSSILGRDRAIVINLEHIKAIITATEVLMINSSNPLFLQFVQDLQARLPCSNETTPPQEMLEIKYTVNDDIRSLLCKESVSKLFSGGPEESRKMRNDMDTDYEAYPLMRGSPSLSSRNDSRNNSTVRIVEYSDAFPGTSNIEIKWGNPKSREDVPVAPVPKQLPFEFRALEACLESACRCLESETRTLEEEAYPALDELTSQISTLNLERVRQIKSRLVALYGRVQKVRDELEHLLDDDNDMAEMYLTQKLAARLLDQGSIKEGYNAAFEDDDRSVESNSQKSDSSFGPKLDVEELEMLLEAYFAQIDGILQKLSSLSEYVDDTEDCINIMLDDKQNQLLQAAVTFNTLNMIVNAGIVVVGLFGMNIHITLFDGQPLQFWSTTFGTLGGCILLFFIAFGWGKKRYLFSS